MFEIVLEKYPLTSSKYSLAKFKKHKKKLKIPVDSKNAVLLNGVEYFCTNVDELCEAVTTGKWDEPIYFNNLQNRFKLVKVKGHKPLTKRNPKTLSDAEVYGILIGEINSLLEYNNTSTIYVDSVIKGLSKKHKISVKRFEEVFDKNC